MLDRNSISEYRIAMVINDITMEKGGAERVVTALAEYFRPRVKRIDVIVFDNTRPKYKFPGNLIDLDCPPRQGSVGKIINLLRRAFRLKKYCRKNKYTHIFAFMESANFPTILSCSGKAIVSVRNNPDKFDATTQKIMRLLYKKAYAVIGVSQAVENCLAKNYHLSNTGHIPNPLNIDYIHGLANIPLRKSSKYMLAVGRLHRQKGFDLLIQAYAISQSSQSIELIILGEGEEREALQALVSTFSLEDKIHLPGETANPYQYMKNAELFVLSSRYEGYPNVLIEALACDCPVIAANCPTGPNEIIIDGVNGILIDKENIDQLATAMDELMGNTRLQQQFKENAANTVSQLSLDKIAEQWLKL